MAVCSVQIIDGVCKARVALPELAAFQYDGSGIGQAAMFASHYPDRDSRDFLPAGESFELLEAWKTAETRKVGRGHQRVIEAGADELDELITAFEALGIACEQNQEPAEARACWVAAERCREAFRELRG